MHTNQCFNCILVTLFSSVPRIRLDLNLNQHKSDVMLLLEPPSFQLLH